ncbi:fibroin heavy chain-like [Ornithodoros turicata]|uniref:fibroin heavy chain-like n=1 Tax=Ornithodoros turicata TaxID=34597 RepID=UPI00313A0CA3
MYDSHYTDIYVSRAMLLGNDGFNEYYAEARDQRCKRRRTFLRALTQVLVLLAFVAVARAGYLGAPAAVVASVAEAGHSNSHRAQDLAGNYNFGYNEAHTSGGSSRQETGDAFGNKVGSYSLTDADGRVRVVKYVADAAGFRASVSTNEPGTAPSTPAAAGYNAPVVAPAPVGAYAAPVAAVATAPIAAYAAPVATYAAPVAAYAAPVAKAYAAPVAAYAAPVAAAAHVYGPAVAGYGAYAAPAVSGKALAHGAAYGLGYGVHANHNSRFIMKVLVLLAFVAVARAGYLGAPAAVVASVAEAGHSNSHRAQDLAGNYNFGYNEAHTTGGSSRQETGDAFGNKVGSYSLTDADGRVRVVKYVADAAGFRASVSTNEPGTAPSTPAAAGYNAPVVAPAPVAAPVATYAAPVAKAYAAPVGAYAAPVAAAAHVYGPAVAGYGAYGAYGAYAAPAVYGKALAHARAHPLINYEFRHVKHLAMRSKRYKSCRFSVRVTILSHNSRFIMKVLVLLAFVAVARAGYLGAPAAVVASVAEVGHSNSHRAQDLAGNYNFGYNEAHTSGGSSRQETGDVFGNKVGSYSLHDADGRVRVVKYVADAAGFRASVSTNEPGTAPSTPAAAGYNAPVVAPAPVAAYAAPVAAVATAPVAAYAAPVAAYAAPVAKAYAAPVAAYAAPVAAAAHVYGPAVAGYGAYGAYAAPAVYGKALAHGAAYGLGYGSGRYVDGGDDHTAHGRLRNIVTSEFERNTLGFDWDEQQQQQHTALSILPLQTACAQCVALTAPFHNSRFIMKVLVLLAFVAVARAGYLGAPAAVVASVAEVGHSNSHRAQDLAGNYNFGYNEAHTSGGSSRQETGDAFGNKVGSYSLTDADGRVRVVKYVADAAGFRASVSTNEPGTAPSTPAAAGYNAPVVAPAPVTAYAAPVAAVATAPVAAYAAPVAAYAAPVAKAYAAPVAAYAAPVAAAAHVYGPAVAGYGAYGAYAAPAVYGKALAHGAAYGLGYGVHAKHFF